jgi:IS5 family transposase
MNPVRTLTYRFFDLSHIVRIDVARSAGLYHDEDEGLQDFELFARIFERAAADNALAALWDTVERMHADGKYPSNPFAPR